MISQLAVFVISWTVNRVRIIMFDLMTSGEKLRPFSTYFFSIQPYQPRDAVFYVASVGGVATDWVCEVGGSGERESEVGEARNRAKWKKRV